MNELKFQWGHLFTLKEDLYIRDGFLSKGAVGHIVEINESEYDGDGTLTPYKIFFRLCRVEEGEELRIDEDKKLIGGSDWFSEKEVESLFVSIIKSEKISEIVEEF